MASQRDRTRNLSTEVARRPGARGGRISLGAVVLAVVATVIVGAIRRGGSGATGTDGAVDDETRPAVHVFEVPGGGYGYRISTEEGIVIHQPHVPAISGKAGFVSAGDARAVADLVVRRIESATELPTVSREDLDSLDVTMPGRESATTSGRELPPPPESPPFRKEGS